jgi:hypothetical protein
VYRASVGANPVPTTGAPNQLSLEFDGVAQRVFVPDDPAFQLTHSLTLEAFVKPLPVLPPNSAGQIVFRGDDNTARDPYYLVVVGSDFYFDVQSESEEVFVKAPIPSFDQWHHLAGTLDDATGAMKLYVDGVLAASTVTSVRPFAVLDPTALPGLGIGDVQSANYSEHFHGLIDEVRISDVALSPNALLAPEPGSVALLAAGAGLFLTRRARRRSLRSHQLSQA